MRFIHVGIAAALGLGGLPGPAAAQGAPASIEGEWTSDCLPIGKNGRHGTVIRLTIRDGAIRATSQLFARSTCQTPTVQANFSGKLEREARRDRRVDFDILVDELVTTTHRAEVVEHYNHAEPGGAGCGRTDWQVNRPVSTAGLTCGPFTWPAVGAHLYESAWIEGDELRFGALPFDWTNVSPDKRPSGPSSVTFHRTGL